MKKLILFLLTLQFPIHAMKNTHQTWNIKKTINHTTNIKQKCVAYNETSKQLLLLDDKNVTLANIDNEKQSIVLPHFSCWWKPSFDPSGRYLITNPDKKRIMLLNMDGKEITTIKQSSKNQAEKVKFNHPGNQILFLNRKNIMLRNLDGTLITNYNLEKENTIRIAKFFPNNDNLIFIAPQYWSRDSIKLWDVRNKNLITYDYINPLQQASIHPEGNYLSGIPDNGVGAMVACIYDLRKKGHLQLTNFEKSRSAKFNSQGTHILTNYDSLALLWSAQAIIQRINTQEEYAEFTLQLDPANFSSATFHPDGNNILIHSTERINPENNFTIYDLAGNQLAKMQPEKKICSAKYDPTGNYIITTHTDNIVNLWQKE